jgi:pyridoxal phosphate enzyme (YggS family)
MTRIEELADNLEAVRVRIVRACEVAGRPAGEVGIIAVTKTWPASDVSLLADLGLREVGENRHQEGEAKRAASPTDLTWHHIGRLQRNKARSVTRWADVVHGLDRAELITPLAGARPGLPVLVQVSLDGDPTRGGCAPELVPALARDAAAEGLDVRGVMAVAPVGHDPEVAFGRLAELSADLRAAMPAAGWISAGMSGDLEAAVHHGATHLRLGSVLLGPRVRAAH